MSYLVLARKYRPQAFDDVTGQEHVVQTLANAIAQDRVAHAFLLCGPRGVGKTTTARLLARALNCAEGPTATPCGTCQPCREIVAGSSVDVVEIDGASNNGVDNVRELREAARYMPQRDRHKIFIIDEVHMLSVAAFNALLKTLEEPPPHVKFIFATTDPQKLPDTILSRCQRHNFRRVPAEKMVERLRFICEAEGISISDRALRLVARQADGGMRDALSLLDQLLSSAGTEIADGAVEEALGLVDRTVVHEIADALLDRDGRRVVEAIASVYDRGVDARRLCEELAQHLRDLVYVKAIGAAPGDRGDVEQQLLVEQAKKADAAQITRLFDLVHHAIRELSYAAQPRLALEVALLSAVHLAPAQGLADLAARLEAVAGALTGGAAVPAAAPRGAPAQQMRPPAPPAAPQRQPAQMPTNDLLKQVEALTRGRGAPRQAGGRPPGRGTPGAGGSDEEPHGARGPVGRAAPPSAPSRFAPPGTPAPRQMQRPMPAERRPVEARPSAPPPPWDEDEPPPPGDDDAPGWSDEDPFAGMDVRPVEVDTSPGGCATNECRDDAPAPPADGRRAGGDAFDVLRAALTGRAPSPAPPNRAAPAPASAPTAPRAAPAPGPALARGDDPTAEVHVRWRDAVEALRRENPIIGSCLSEGRLLWLRPGQVALGYTPSNHFHRAQLETTFARQVEEMLSRWFGAPTKLHLQEAAADAPASVAEEQRKAREERRNRLRAEAREHPAVLAVQTILGGEIDDIEVLEER